MKVGDASAGNHTHRTERNNRRNQSVMRETDERARDTVRLSNDAKKNSSRVRGSETVSSAENRKNYKPEKDKTLVKADGKPNASGDQALKRTIEKCRRDCEKLPDVRSEKVAEARSNIESGVYSSDEVVNKIAERLINKFGL